MHYFSYLSTFICLVQCVYSLLEVCNNAPWSLCSPRQNETWYHYNYYNFTWNKNSSSVVNSSSDLYILTIAGQNGTERTIKSWFDLTGNTLTVQVTDDWFPKALTTGSSNLTWTVYGFVLPHNYPFPADIINLPSMDELSNFEPNTQFNVIQTVMKPIIITQEKLKHEWILAIIIVACTVVIIAICVFIWAWKNMQKMKKAKNSSATNNNPYQQQDNQSNNKMQSSILSTPDAMMIADTFRQVMSTSDLDKSRNQVGKDLLTRQLLSEGTSVSQVERRTSSTKN